MPNINTAHPDPTETDYNKRQQQLSQSTPEDILGTPDLSQESVPNDLNGDVGSPTVPDLAKEGNNAVVQGLGIEKNIQDSAPTNTLLQGINNQGKINAEGLAGASETSHRKYDSAASQKIYDDLNAQNASNQANRQKTADSLLKKGLTLQKEPGELAKQSIENKILGSKAKVQEGTEQLQIEESAAKAKGVGLQNTELQQKIDFANERNPVELANLRAKTQLELINVRRLGKMDRKLSPALATEYAKVLKLDPDTAANLTYEDADLLVKGRVGGLNSTKLPLDEQRKQTIVKAVTSDKQLQAADDGIREADNLKRLTNMNGNQVAQSLTQIAKIKSLLNSGRITNQEMNNTGLQSLDQRVTQFLDRIGTGELSPEAKREYNEIADEAARVWRDIKQSRAQRHIDTYSATYKDLDPQEIINVVNAASGNNTQNSQSQSQMIKMVDPKTGHSGSIPADKLEQFKLDNPTYIQQ